MIHGIFRRPIFILLGVYLAILITDVQEIKGAEGDSEIAAHVSFRRYCSKKDNKKGYEKSEQKRSHNHNEQEGGTPRPKKCDQYIEHYVATQYVCKCCVVS